MWNNSSLISLYLKESDFFFSRHHIVGESFLYSIGTLSHYLKSRFKLLGIDFFAPIGLEALIFLPNCFSTSIQNSLNFSKALNLWDIRYISKSRIIIFKGDEIPYPYLARVLMNLQTLNINSKASLAFSPLSIKGLLVILPSI